MITQNKLMMHTIHFPNRVREKIRERKLNNMKYNLKIVVYKIMMATNVLFILSFVFNSRLLSYAALFLWAIHLIIRLKLNKGDSKLLAGFYAMLLILIVGIMVYPILKLN